MFLPILEMWKLRLRGGVTSHSSRAAWLNERTGLPPPRPSLLVGVNVNSNCRQKSLQESDVGQRRGPGQIYSLHEVKMPFGGHLAPVSRRCQRAAQVSGSPACSRPKWGSSSSSLLTLGPSARRSYTSGQIPIRQLSVLFHSCLDTRSTGGLGGR